MTRQNTQSSSDDVLVLPASLIAENSSELWDDILKRFGSSYGNSLTIDATNLRQIDESGVALLYQLIHLGPNVQVINLSEDIKSLYQGLTENFQPRKPVPREKLGWISCLGKNLCNSLEGLRNGIAFIGETSAATIGAIFHPSQLKSGEIVSVSQDAGTDAVGIVCLIGFLMGIIIAFETALVAKIFGAVIFVVNGIGVAMTRELGPLMTAILYAGRSGSAFAAQLGTMKVNEELNAITTFGLNPVRFLVVPRIIASVIVVPLLSIFATLIGVIGGGIIMGLYDITFTQFYVQLLGATSIVDVLFGVVKAAIFGYVIALIGCYCGLQTGAGAAAVGSSTTKSVVLSIVWIVVIDGIAALLMNQIGV